MIQAASGHGISSVSPVSRNSKHQTTPVRLRRKTSRKDPESDVHTACSTPNRLQPEIRNYSYSPSDTFPYSQENCPEVIWDYTSPKLPKGTKKRELKITVDEFLKNLTHHQAPECNTQTSHYIKLLEKWMAKQNSPVCVIKPHRRVKRDSKMRSRRIYEDMKNFMISIEQEKEEIAKESEGKESTSGYNLPKEENPNQLSAVLNKRPFLEDTKDNDSIEELWGETDNSFIIKATQHLDVLCTKSALQNKNFDIVSTIPETIISTSDESKCTTFEAEQSTSKYSLNKAMSDSDYQAQILLTQVLNCDWESDSDNEDLENGFIVGDDTLSLIPDDVLCGTNAQNAIQENINQSIAGNSCSKEISGDEKSRNNICENEKHATKKLSCEMSFGSFENDEVSAQTIDQSEIELFNNFEDESFGDESILCKPEVLSWIDEVESKLSQSQKCTPEEIEKKKDEAIQRRKRNRSRTLNS